MCSSKDQRQKSVEVNTFEVIVRGARRAFVVIPIAYLYCIDLNTWRGFEVLVEGWKPFQVYQSCEGMRERSRVVRNATSASMTDQGSICWSVWLTNRPAIHLHQEDGCMGFVLGGCARIGFGRRGEAGWPQMCRQNGSHSNRQRRRMCSTLYSVTERTIKQRLQYNIVEEVLLSVIYVSLPSTAQGITCYAVYVP
jgi:hypothetical protein